MSNNNLDLNEQWAPPPPPGMRTGVKVLLGATLGCAVILLLLVGGFIALVAVFGAKGASTDPAVVDRLRREIVSIEIPDSLEPTASFQLPAFLNLCWVFYADRQNRSTLVLNTSDAWKIDDPQRARTVVERSLRAQQHESGAERIQQRQTSQKVVKIRGQMIPFTITVGQGVESKTLRLNVLGIFPGREYPVLLMFDGDATVYPEPRIVRMLESIGQHPPPAAAPK